ncbi:MAG TPA: hypothetical protein VFK05_31910 [Polyangiaceae bacterium]|nr:hypothetical protein [Polyangiaceae bacterium]
MPIANLNSSAQIVILAARKESQPAAGERERLEALLNVRIGTALEAWPALDQSLAHAPERAP